jgi:hypothetical protein
MCAYHKDSHKYNLKTIVRLGRMRKISESVRNGSLHYVGYTKLYEGNVCFLIRHTEYNYDEMALLLDK